MKDMIQDRGYFSAGSIARIKYTDGQVAENPVYAKIDTHLSEGTNQTPAYTCYIEALWVEPNGAVRVRREPVHKMKITMRQPEEPSP